MLFKSIFRKFYGLSWFIKDYLKFRKLFDKQKSFKILKIFPVIADRSNAAGIIGGMYFNQDLLAARRIFVNKPLKHVDIGSRTDGFVAHVASFREIEVFDIRHLENKIKNIHFTQMDLMKLPKHLVDYTDSISSLCVIEHFGLGRYGDPLDVDGHIRGLDNIYKILKKGGKFYFSVPIGPQRIEFNAHRIFDVQYLLDLFDGKYNIDMFSYTDDNGDLHEDVHLTDHSIKNNYGCKFGNGIFELTKI